MATMTKAKAIRKLSQMSRTATESALVEQDTGRRGVLLGTAVVLTRVQWTLESKTPEAVEQAYRDACSMDTYDREAIPSDVWEWMSEKGSK